MPDENTVKINPLVSLALHPMQLTPEAKVLNAEGHPLQHVYTAAADAMTKMYGIASDIFSANRAAHDENLVRNAELIQIAERTGTQVPGSYMGKDGKITYGLEPAVAINLNTAIDAAYYERMGPTFDSARAVIKSSLATSQAEIAHAIRDPRGESMPALHDGTEFRSYIRSLPEAERSTFVRNAIAQGDVTVVHAVCSRLAGLSGLTDAMQKSLKQQAEEKFAPAAYANAQALAKLDAKLMEAGEAANRHRIENLVNVTAKQSISLAAMNKLRGKKEAAK